MATKKRGFGGRPKPREESASPEEIDTFVSEGVAALSEAEPAPSQKMIKTTVELPEQLHRGLKAYAALQGTSMTSLIQAWIKENVPESLM